jgi:hypothetical protein
MGVIGISSRLAASLRGRVPGVPTPVIPAVAPSHPCHPGRSVAESRTNARSALNSRRLARRASAASNPSGLGWLSSAYIASGALQFTSTGKTFRLVLAVDETAERILRETALSEDQEIRIRASQTTVRATVADSWQLRWWILGQGDLVEVLKPAALRREIAETCQRMAARYTARNAKWTRRARQEVLLHLPLLRCGSMQGVAVLHSAKDGSVRPFPDSRRQQMSTPFRV